MQMGVSVIILGASGSGKSTSLRNFKPGEIGILNTLGKPLPFRKKLDSYDRPSYQQVQATIKSGKRRAWVVDDATFLLENANFARANEHGFDKFVQIAVDFQKTLMAAIDAPDGTITYFMMHNSHDDTGREEVKTIGKMLTNQWSIEGTVPILIDCKIVDGKHVFSVANDGMSLAKAPMGMFENDTFGNDLKYVDDCIRAYWELPPLIDKNGGGE